MSIPNSKILSQVVSEKSLTEKKVYKQTIKHSYRKGKNSIPPIYFVCRGYNNFVAGPQTAHFFFGGGGGGGGMGGGGDNFL